MNTRTHTPGFLSRSAGPLHINLDRQVYPVSYISDFEKSIACERWAAFVRNMFSGKDVNGTEHRAAGHWTLRAAACPALYPQWVELKTEGRDDIAMATQVARRMENFVEQVQSGVVKTPDGVKYDSILHLGIGGSDLGPRLLNDVFSKLHLKSEQGLNIHFVANVDFHEMQSVLASLNPKTTLVVIASKSFSTKETLLNAGHILNWLSKAGPQYRQSALVGATCKPEKAQAFGIAADRIFEFSETVGGRYSLWGPVSLGVRMVYGNAVFNQFLEGAARMDAHVLNAKPTDCLPTLLALSDLYNLQHGVDALMLSPYDSRLNLLEPYLQQLWMESLGKGFTVDGQAVANSTCPILWGDVGTNGQHAFFQLLHQGKNACSVEIMAVLEPDHAELNSHRVLLSHALAQAEAFSVGRLNSPAELGDPGVNFKACPGQRPVQMMFLDKLTPHSLGALLCLWEHRTCALAAMQNINPFDQWGVELGKVIAEQIEPNLKVGQQHAENAITAHLIDHFIHARKAT